MPRLPLIIIKQESPETSGVGTCANCGKLVPVRPVEELGFIARESRGWHQICYDCFGPRIFWKRGEMGQTYESPVRAYSAPITVCDNGD